MPLWVIDVAQGKAQNESAAQLLVVAPRTGIIICCGMINPTPKIRVITQNHFLKYPYRTKKAIEDNRAYQKRLVVLVIIIEYLIHHIKKILF